LKHLLHSSTLPASAVAMRVLYHKSNEPVQPA
jgi:hypothetical protein